MNRIEFMNQLERLLQNISPAEREEALKYYNDYFNDAGVENEQDVIEALGNPAKVAETIKRDLYGAGYEESVFQKEISSDRAVVEYGNTAVNKKEDAADQSAVNAGAGQTGNGGLGQGAGCTGGYGNGQAGGQGAGYAGSYGNGQAGGQSTGYTGSYGNGQAGTSYSQSGSYGGYGSTQVQPVKKTSTGMIVLIVLICVLASPVLVSVAAGVISLVAGLVTGWFGLILGFGITAIVLFIVMFCLMAVGIAGIIISPTGAVGMIGGGLVCGGIGLLFLMLTVLMAGVATPAIIRWISSLFRRKRKAM